MPPDRPVHHLSDAELLHLLAGTRRLRETERRYERLADVVNRTMDQLRHELGLTPAGARRLAAACELHRRVAQAPAPKRPQLSAPEDVVRHMAWAGSLDHERFWVLPLDARSRLIGEGLEISRGCVDGTDAGPRSFLRHALRVGAVNTVAVHNHPSGDPTPSAADVAVTRRLIAAGAVADVHCQDHVIVGAAGSFTSLRREQAALWSGR